MMRFTIAFIVCVILIFIFRPGVTGYNDLNYGLFIANTLLNGYSCAGDLAVRVPRDDVEESRSKCASKCENHYECVGFFHKIDGSRNTCLLCNQLFNSAATASLVEMAGSEYFRRSVCHGWVHGVKKLRIFSETVKHSIARTRCQETGGVLLRIKDESHMNQIQAALTSCKSYKTSTYYWTDGTLDSSTNTWTYPDVTAMPMAEEEYWDPGSPDGNGQCTRLKYRSPYNKYLWNDYGCNNQYRFICEYN